MTMNEQAADKKAKRNLEHAAAIIMCWTPKEKRDYYLNYFQALKSVPFLLIYCLDNKTKLKVPLLYYK